MSHHGTSQCLCTCCSLFLEDPSYNHQYDQCISSMSPHCWGHHLFLRVRWLGHSELAVVLIGYVFDTGAKTSQPKVISEDTSTTATITWAIMTCLPMGIPFCTIHFIGAGTVNAYLCSSCSGSRHLMVNESSSMHLIPLIPTANQSVDKPCRILFVRFLISLLHFPFSQPSSQVCVSWSLMWPIVITPNSPPALLLSPLPSSSWWFLLY